jgi:5-methylthioadenosine/S-adenosylhomocysteine deaminase
MKNTNHIEETLNGNCHNPDLIIQGGMILTMVDHQAPISDGSVSVSNGIISRVGEDSEGVPDKPGVEIINTEGCLVMPGLVNAHTHTAMTLFRGYADDLPLKKWLFEKIFPAEARYLNPESVYWGALLGCLEMIRSGTTSFIDGYFFQDETFRAADKAGMRAVIAQGVIDFPAPGVPDPSDNLKVAKDFIEKWRDFSQLITPALFCHSPVTCSEKTLRDARRLSDDFNLPLQIHLSETEDEVHEIVDRTGERPVHYLREIGVLDGDLIAAHAIHVDESEMEILGQKDIKVVHLPESNMKLCSGASPVKEMMEKGITLGLGTDGCSSNNDLDMFLEMDTAAKISKVMDLDPVGLDAKTVLEIATSRGSSFLGRQNNVGTLEKGKKADIIVVDLGSPHLCPVYDPVSLMVYSASGADVRDVIVDGRILMKNRKFMTLDPEEIMASVRRICSKFET